MSENLRHGALEVQLTEEQTSCCADHAEIVLAALFRTLLTNFTTCPDVHLCLRPAARYPRTVKAAYVTPYTRAGIERLKTPLLYFDKLVIQDRNLLEVEINPVVVGPAGEPAGVITEIHSLVGDEFRGEIALLIKEGVVEVSKPDTNKNFKPVGQHVANARLANDALMRVDGPTVSFREPEDAFEILARFQAPVEVGNYIDIGFLHFYYGGLLADAVHWARDGVAVVSGSESLYRIIEAAASKEFLGSQASGDILTHMAETLLVRDIVDESVLDVSSLSFDEILEARVRFHPEFEALQAALDSLTLDLVEKYGPEKVLREGRRIAAASIRPRLAAIESAMRSSKLSTMKNLFSLLKDPKSYVPIVASAAPAVPLELMLLVSAGIIGAQVAIEYVESRRAATSDPLYFLVRSRKLAAERGYSQQPQLPSSQQNDSRYRQPNLRRTYVWPDRAIPLKPAGRTPNDGA